MNDTKRTGSVVLYVDDDSDDLLLTEEAFRRYPGVKLITFSDSYKFLKYIIDNRSSGLLPALIMIDINMPLLNGRELLTILRSYKEFKTIPMALYTTSSQTADRNFARGLNARFITKPDSDDELNRIIDDLIESYRLSA
jgi:CheY-like chemotaxis protein